ncbi:MAG TPA: hypothetical protein PKA88_01100 [Polyangiaceae bacterium]|nr:hypothetical protein [Polyangiaceae bacterium]HMR74567.1 hypothetical protein [Polyangiaceae bacterium]
MNSTLAAHVGLMVLFAAQFFGCGAGSGPTAAPPSEPSGEDPAAHAARLDALVAEATDNAMKINESQRCHFFERQSRDQIAEGLREEVAQGIEGNDLEVKENGLRCLAKASSCVALKDCMQAMD